MRKLPAPTKGHALANALLLIARMETGDQAAALSIAQVVGFACTTDDVEEVRKFILYQAAFGPLKPTPYKPAPAAPAVQHEKSELPPAR